MVEISKWRYLDMLVFTPDFHAIITYDMTI